MVFQPLNLLWILANTKAREIAYFDVFVQFAACLKQ